MPVPESIRKKLLGNDPVHFEGTEPDDARTLPAHWIADAARQGKRIDIKNAIISGPLNLQYCTFQEEFSLVSCDILHPADFSYSTFQRNLILSSTTFQQGADFTSATLCYDGDLGETRFISQLRPAFRERLPAELGAQIPTPVTASPPADTLRKVLHQLYPQQAAQIPDEKLEEVFRGLLLGPAIFRDLHVRGVFSARGAHFRYGVKVNFNRARFEKSAFFRAATFEGEADFTGAHIGRAEFQGATFKQKASFNAARIEGSAFFRAEPQLNLSAATFEGEADFTGAHIGRQAEFQGATFGNTVSFAGAEIGGEAIFWDIRLAPSSEVSFSGAHFHHQVYFSGVLDGELWLDHARFDADTSFENVLFKGLASFRETRFRVVYFSSHGQAQGQKNQFQASIDLRGCTYERIKCDWKSLLRREKPATSLGGRILGWLTFWKQIPPRQQPYDRQPYTQLEKVLRAVGQDDEANKVYLERRRVERQHQKKGISWFFDWIYWWGANYGVHPYRLLLFAVLLLALGTVAFQHPAAVQPNQPPVVSTTQEAARQQKPEFNAQPLGFWDAARLSLRSFLPVDVPLLADWQPSDNRWFWAVKFSDLAGFLKIMGWILVPVAIASITGLLRRVAP
ncbi:pentapeptide repeat-containing protein [Acidobacteriia bacterium AH_259_A11_L15]|nr:pentapeptide repeat-containing protein [Acidobacteriia bacterium AH_259_A11_L15]